MSIFQGKQRTLHDQVFQAAAINMFILQQFDELQQQYQLTKTIYSPTET
jgi:hypothetical protein